MNNKRRHIIFLARWYPNRYDPMFGLFVQRHAEAAALFQNISVVYAHASENQKQKYEICQVLNNEVNEIVVYYKKVKSDSVFGKAISFFRFLKANKLGICQAKKLKGKVDIFHVHVLTRLGLIALYYKWFYKIPYLITEHWSRYLPKNDFNGFLRKKVTKLVVKNAEMVTAATEKLAQAMQNHDLKNPNYVVLHNVVDMRIFCFSENLSQEKVKMIHVSCFEDKSKNVSGLLRCLSQLKKEEIDFECTMVGDGIDFQTLRKYATDLQLDSNVRFTGVLEGQAVADEIAKANFMLLFSNYETQGVVLLESFACGRPVVATRVGGIPEIVNDENGIMVESGNEQAFVEAIKIMMKTYLKYNSKTLRQNVEQDFGCEQVGKTLNQWYSDILLRYQK